MTPQVISVSSAASSAWIPVDYKQNPFNIDIAVVLSNTPSLTYKVEYTLDDIFNPAVTPTAFSHISLISLTAGSTGTIKSPVRAIRLTITSWTSGTATMTALQGVVNPALFNLNGDLVSELKYHTIQHSGLTKNRISDLLSWCYPTHINIMDPSRHTGMTPIVNGALTMTQIVSAEYPGSAIQLDITGAGTTSAHLLFPATAETALNSYTVKAGGEIHFRIKVSDWSKITSLECYFCQDGGIANYRNFTLVMANKTQFGGTDPTYSAVWNNQWRTIVFDSTDAIAGGSPDPWGNSARYFDVTGLRFICVVTGAVNIQIARVYSAEWPIGVVVPIFDAWYKSAQLYAEKDLLPRNWGCGGSILSIAGAAKNPTETDIIRLASHGWDVFAHSHGISGGVITGLSGAATEVQIRQWFSEHIRIVRQSGSIPPGSRWNQFYQNLAQYSAGTDMAGILKSYGINASRGDTPDAEFGVNPATVAYMSLGSTAKETWARRRGRFNTRPLSAYTNMLNTDNYDAAGQNLSFPTLKSRVAFSALAKTPTVTYFHEIVDTPTVSDNTPAFWNGFIDHLSALTESGDIVVISPTDLELLTYWRPGEIYMRWDGEWVYRHDPTKIAF